MMHKRVEFERRGGWTLEAGTVPAQGKKGNQDAYGIQTVRIGAQEAILLGVMDGVSRCAYGGAVARCLAQTIQEKELSLNPDSLGAQLIVTVEQWRERVRAKLGNSSDMLESACTLTLVLLLDNRFIGCFLGDSPAYRVTPGSTPPAIESVFQVHQAPSGALTRVFRPGTPMNPQLFEGKLESGEILLLCTDGLNEIWDPMSLAELLCRGSRSVGEELLAWPFRDDATFIYARA